MTDVTGPYRLPHPEDDQPSPDAQPNPDDTGGFIIRSHTNLHHEAVRRNEWLPRLLALIRREAFSEGYRQALTRTHEIDHQREHLDIPLPLIQALQRGVNLANPLNGADVTIDGIEITIGVSRHGTGIPEPDTKRVWDDLCDTIRNVRAAPYCENVIAPLPREIATVIWTDAQGRRVQINPTARGQGLRRAFALCVFAPATRLTDLMGAAGAATATTVASATLIAGVPSDGFIPAQPPPSLQPKTSIAAPAVGRRHASTRPPHQARPDLAASWSDAPPKPMGLEPAKPKTNPTSPKAGPHPEPSGTQSPHPSNCPKANASPKSSPTTPAPSTPVQLPEEPPSVPAQPSGPAHDIIDDVASALPIPLPTGL